MEDKLLFSAPMAGVTDKPFRLILRKFTSRPLYTEMIGIATLYHNHHVTRKMLHISDEKDIIVQLVGIEEKYMEHATKEALFYGAKGIDINMGCPVKKLITNGSGASLMKDELKACHLIESVKKIAGNIPVSVKTRIGWDKEHVNICSFSKSLENAGVDRITIHGRTKEAGYSGEVDRSAIKKAKQNLSIPVIANGDIVDKVSADEMIKITNADGLMIGRGLLGKPWVISEIDGLITPKFNLVDLILEHLDLMLSYYGNHGLLVARKHLAWYASGFEGKGEFLNQLYQEKDVDKAKKMIKDFFGYRK